jgi:1,4-alpha-glucan branching enzyme/maltooligosyltrehalose trehalohydrolase
MPFGAAVLDDGEVRFRLWAPAATRVELRLNPGNVGADYLPMDPEGDGWFSVATRAAGASTRYLYCIDGGQQVPDPASRYQPDDVHGASEVVDPRDWLWSDQAWTGRAWHEAVIYELHVGSFTRRGDFAGVEARLDHLVDLGVTALELMPVGAFPGQRNWGYDGVQPFAPDRQYGRPEDLKALVAAAHARGLMILLDVVYNHFGPEGNYLHLYAPQFFNPARHTPWGAAINFDGPENHWVREFFVHNALYWLDEFHFDGLRLDAVHAIHDASRRDILIELAERVHATFGDRRQVHLVLENDHNSARYLKRGDAGRPRWYAAQWNDDQHHALHVLLTGETDGYYQDYATDPLRHFGRSLAEGFAYQGEPSPYRDDRPRGEPSGHLPAEAFVGFLQNHDQIGNRAFGERLDGLVTPAQLRAALSILLLAPSPPLLFMGQEWGCDQPFPFFCDFGPDLAEKVVAGRREEFAHFPAFRDPAARRRIPNPMSPKTFAAAVLDWDEVGSAPHAASLDLHRRLLGLRRDVIMPRLDGACSAGGWQRSDGHGLSVRWILADGSALTLIANLGDTPVTPFSAPHAWLFYATHPDIVQDKASALPPWSVAWYLASEKPVA